MAEATWTDIEKRKLEERLRYLEAQVRRTARDADKRSTGAKYTIPEDQVQIDGDVSIDGSLTVDQGATIRDPLVLVPGEISFQTTAERERASIETAGGSVYGYDDLIIKAGNVGDLPGRLYLSGQGTESPYMARLILNAYNSIATLFVTDAGGTGKVEVTSSGVQLNDAGATVDEFSTDGTLAGDSDTALPTEKAVKTYADALGAAQDWTPTVDQGGAVTVTVSAAKYVAIGDMVMLLANLAVTGTGTAGNAIIVSGWPSAINSLAGWNTVAVGTCNVVDTGTATYWGVTFHSSTTAIRFIDSNTQGQIGANPSFALASGDLIKFSLFYTR